MRIHHPFFIIYNRIHLYQFNRRRKCRHSHNRYRNRCIAKFVFAFCFIMITGLATGSIISYANAKSQSPESPDFEKVSYKYYTSIQIADGDSLQSIAKRYITKEYTDVHTYIYEMMQMNSLDDETIHTGQFLIIPYYSEQLK